VNAKIPPSSPSGRRLAAGSVILTAVFLAAVAAGYPFLRRFIPVQAVPIRALWQNRDRWLGARVRCAGELKIFSPRTPERYFVLEQDSYRLQILGVPRRELEPLAGRKVSVSGRFEFKQGLGVYLLAGSIRPKGGD